MECRDVLSLKPGTVARIFTRADLNGPFKHIVVGPDEIIAVFKAGSLMRTFNRTTIGSRGSLVEKMQGWLGRSTAYELLYADTSEQTLAFSIGKDSPVHDRDGIHVKGRVCLKFEIYPYAISGLYPLVRARSGRTLTLEEVRKMIKEDLFTEALMPCLAGLQGPDIRSAACDISLEFAVRRALGRRLYASSIELVGIDAQFESQVVECEKVHVAQELSEAVGEAKPDLQSKVDRILASDGFDSDIEELEALIEIKKDRDRRKKRPLKDPWA